jgi:hypothetical protein
MLKFITAGERESCFVSLGFPKFSFHRQTFAARLGSWFFGEGNEHFRRDDCQAGISGSCCAASARVHWRLVVVSSADDSCETERSARIVHWSASSGDSGKRRQDKLRDRPTATRADSHLHAFLVSARGIPTLLVCEAAAESTDSDVTSASFPQACLQLTIESSRLVVKDRGEAEFCARAQV